MLALSHRYIGKKLDMGVINMFVDYCNSNICNGNVFSSSFLPTIKAIPMSMQIEVSNPDGSTESKEFVLNKDERDFIENLFGKNGWFCFFTRKQFIKDTIHVYNDESADVLRKIDAIFPDTYEGIIFILTTYKFGTPEESQVPQSKAETESVEG